MALFDEAFGFLVLCVLKEYHFWKESYLYNMMRRFREKEFTRCTNLLIRHGLVGSASAYPTAAAALRMLNAGERVLERDSAHASVVNTMVAFAETAADKRASRLSTPLRAVQAALKQSPPPTPDRPPTPPPDRPADRPPTPDAPTAPSAPSAPAADLQFVLFYDAAAVAAAPRAPRLASADNDLTQIRAYARSSPFLRWRRRGAPGPLPCAFRSKRDPRLADHVLQVYREKSVSDDVPLALLKYLELRGVDAPTRPSPTPAAPDVAGRARTLAARYMRARAPEPSVGWPAVRPGLGRPALAVHKVGPAHLRR
ncbi:uncharacterized protein V1510DRAFT_286940 [Dipodascopsis tothii]|uniref:uncharacterized protein n=1 Tax=Dipodascopsis tothii TaxID=44089 RepID=UPI0034CEB2BB